MADRGSGGKLERRMADADKKGGLGTARISIGSGRRKKPIRSIKNGTILLREG
jgi:hypothetical protein